MPPSTVRVADDGDVTAESGVVVEDGPFFGGRVFAARDDGFSGSDELVWLGGGVDPVAGEDAGVVVGQ